MPDEDIRHAMDFHATGNLPYVDYYFWMNELRRRTEVRLTEELITVTAKLSEYGQATATTSASMEKLLRASSDQTDAMLQLTKTITWWTRMTGAISAVALVIALAALATHWI